MHARFTKKVLDGIWVGTEPVLLLEGDADRDAAPATNIRFKRRKLRAEQEHRIAGFHKQFAEIGLEDLGARLPRWLGRPRKIS